MGAARSRTLSGQWQFVWRMFRRVVTGTSAHLEEFGMTSRAYLTSSGHISTHLAVDNLSILPVPGWHKLVHELPSISHDNTQG
eukprot:6192190-Pleurochrysis_carterae.AAC.4